MKRLSPKIISRALLYIRTLESLIENGAEFISSNLLSSVTGLTDVQIRKDIAAFGKVGKPRVGYDAQELKHFLEDFVTRNTAHVALFGVGNLGKAIIRYPEFQNQKIKLVAAFDVDKAKVDKEISRVPVYDIARAPQIIAQTRAEIGIIAVPKEAAQSVADMMVKSGLKGIVNFAPINVTVPGHVTVRDIDLSIEFLSLFCDLKR